MLSRLVSIYPDWIGDFISSLQVAWREFRIHSFGDTTGYGRNRRICSYGSVIVLERTEVERTDSTGPRGNASGAGAV